jgi:hypothetical protein
MARVRSGYELAKESPAALALAVEQTSMQLATLGVDTSSLEPL